MKSRAYQIKSPYTLVRGGAGLALLALGVVINGSLLAGTINFEGMPTTYYYLGGNQNIGSYWAGVTFGSQATILDSSLYGYNSSSYPPHSGTAVMFSVSNPTIEASFANAAQTVSLWYTAGSSAGLYLEAYTAGNVLVASANGVANIGSDSFLSVTAPSSEIAYVLIHDSGDFYTIDDFSADTISGAPASAPDAGMTAGLLGFTFVGLAGLRRKFSRN